MKESYLLFQILQFYVAQRQFTFGSVFVFCNNSIDDLKCFWNQLPKK